MTPARANGVKMPKLGSNFRDSRSSRWILENDGSSGSEGSEIPGDFESHPHGWATSYPEVQRKRLVDYCTNEWQTNPQYHARSTTPDYDILEDRIEKCWSACVAILTSRKIRRFLIISTSLIALTWYIYTTKVVPAIAEHNMLKNSLLLRDKAPGNGHNGLFGTNVPLQLSDVILIKTLDNKHLPRPQKERFFDPANTKRLIFVGDVHGCKEELESLLLRIQYNPKMDHLVTTGDLISKGPDSLGTVDLVREMGASCVRGNHEDRILLLAKQMNSTLVGQSNRDSSPVGSTHPAEHELAASLSPDQIAYLESCPVILKVGNLRAFGGEVVVVHAGLVPGIPLTKQDPIAVMNMRTIDLYTHVPSRDGAEGPAKDGNRDPPKEETVATSGKKWPYNVRWTKLWNKYQRLLPAQYSRFPSGNPEIQKQREQHTTVIYGHDSKRGLQMEKFTKGIDTGCVNGGKLTAFVIADGGVQYVKDVQCKDYRSKTLSDEDSGSRDGNVGVTEAKDRKD